MKCRSCGYEFSGDKNYCPMCGTRAKDPSVKITEEEMKWNTREFPKPKETRDIPMQWSSPDASEGYVNTPYPSQEFEYNDYSSPYKKDPVAARVPRQEEGRLSEKFNTFVSKNDEFQKLLDKEFERLEHLKVEDQEYRRPYREDRARPIAKIDNARMAKVVKSERFDIDAIEDKIEEIVAEEAKAQAESSERKRKLAAMAAARDAYFKALDNGIFEKPEKKLDKYNPYPSVEEKPVIEKYTYEEVYKNYEDDEPRGRALHTPEIIPAKAFDSNRERTPNGYSTEVAEAENRFEIPKEIQNAPKPEEAVVIEEPEELNHVEDFVDKLEPDVEHTMKFDKDTFIMAEELEEKKDELLSEEERRAKLEAILNEGNKKYDLRNKEIEEKNKEAQERLEKIYEVEIEEDDEEEKRSHPILSILLTIIIIALVAEIAIFLLGKFLPDAEFTKDAIELNDAIIATIEDFFTKVWDKIVEVWGKIKDFFTNIFDGK